MSSIFDDQTTRKTLEEIELCYFENQISGHSCLLKATTTSELLYKPYDKNEYDFYEFVVKNKNHPLYNFIPPYYGVLQLPRRSIEEAVSHTLSDDMASFDFENPSKDLPRTADTSSNSTSTSPRKVSGSKEEWVKSLYLQRFNTKDTRFLKLQDQTSDLDQPCILDLKMGSMAYNPTKMLHQLKKLGQSTSSSLKFRICGLQVKNSKPESDYFRDKYWGRKISKIEINNALALFFYDGNGVRRNLIGYFIKMLQKLANNIKKCVGYKFYSVSLLMIYDSNLDVEALDNYNDDKYYEDYLKSKIKLKLIDFAKTIRNQPSEEPDMDLLTGVENLIVCLIEVQTSLDLSPLLDE